MFLDDPVFLGDPAEDEFGRLVAAEGINQQTRTEKGKQSRMKIFFLRTYSRAPCLYDQQGEGTQ